jgi:hypothetical protein
MFHPASSGTDGDVDRMVSYSTSIQRYVNKMELDVANRSKIDYDEYKNRILWKCLHEWKNVLPIIFDEHKHQSDMMRETIDIATTPLLMYVEADAPLVIEKPIEFDLISQLILDGKANTVRLHHEDVIPKDHDQLMIGVEGKFTKTIQWSQRPHVSSVLYYKEVVLPAIPEKSFIEDTFHGTVQNDYYEHGLIGWFKHRLWIYTPSKGIKRSYHTDGRAGGLKFTADDEANK